MDNALTINEIKSKALDFAPLPLPRGSSGPLASLSWARTPHALRASRGIGSINVQHHDGSAPVARCDSGHVLFDLLTRRRKSADRACSCRRSALQPQERVVGVADDLQPRESLPLQSPRRSGLQTLLLPLALLSLPAHVDQRLLLDEPDVGHDKVHERLGEDPAVVVDDLLARPRHNQGLERNTRGIAGETRLRVCNVLGVQRPELHVAEHDVAAEIEGLDRVGIAHASPGCRAQSRRAETSCTD